MITSDSQFEIAAQANSDDGQGTGNLQEQQFKKPKDVKKNISKTFKKMLTQNHARGSTNTRPGSRNGVDNTNESTKYGGSNIGKDIDAFTVNSEIESKYTRKKLNKGIAKKFYKEDEDQENSFEEIGANNDSPVFKKNKQNKEDIRNLGEFITTKKPKDPFKDLDPLTQKVDIQSDLAYQGTSQNDVLHARIMKYNE